MLLKQLVHCTISSYRWPNHFRYVWLNYQIAAVHYPHWQGSIKKNGTRTRKVSCNFELNSLDRRWHVLFNSELWWIPGKEQACISDENRACTIDFIFITTESSSIVSCLPDQLNPERLDSISDHHHLPAAPQALKWQVPRKNGHRWSCTLTSDYHSGSNSTRKSYKMRDYVCLTCSFDCV